jgi:hypothetical protein
VSNELVGLWISIYYFFNLKIELKPVEYLVFIHKILNLSFESKNDKRAPRGKGKSSCYNVG